MHFDVGSILDGRVTGVTNFGAFVQIGEDVTGMVHISEIASTYVKEVSDFLTVGQSIKVKIINITDDKKIALSIKQLPSELNPTLEKVVKPIEEKPQKYRKPVKKQFVNTYMQGPPPELSGAGNASSNNEFEDMMKKFKQNSEDKISDLKRSNESKRGGKSRK